jgi:hypothetical protein
VQVIEILGRDNVQMSPKQVKQIIDLIGKFSVKISSKNLQIVLLAISRFYMQTNFFSRIGFKFCTFRFRGFIPGPCFLF